MGEINSPAALIVGAGPVGLMTALLLARQGMRSCVVERFQTQHGAPKAHAINPRSLEICRALGLDLEAMRQKATPREDGGFVRFMNNLAGFEIGSLPYERQDDAVLEFTPTPLINLSQPLLEDILLEAVAKSSAIEVKRGLNWLLGKEEGDAVTSTLEDVETRAWTTMTSRYVIGADGAGSSVRENLGIPMIGDSAPQPFITIHFRANLRQIVHDKPAILYWIMQPPHSGVLIAYDIEHTWCLLYPHDPEMKPREVFTREVCLDILRHVIGSQEPQLEIRNILPWVMISEVARNYRQGRVFLVGDAAHRFPPTGGLGLNTGLQDAHNLAWKLAAVEAGQAPDTLLATYESERRAVALTNSRQSYKNAERILGLQASLKDGGGEADGLVHRLRDPQAQSEIRRQIANQREHFDSLALQLGFCYGEKADAAVSNVSDFRPELQVGGRLPHIWVQRQGRMQSLLDLVDDRRFTLFVGPQFADSLSLGDAPVPIQIVIETLDFVSERPLSGHFVDLDSCGAVLVRPDGHVAAIFKENDARTLSQKVARSLDLALAKGLAG